MKNLLLTLQHFANSEIMMQACNNFFVVVTCLVMVNTMHKLLNLDVFFLIVSLLYVVKNALFAKNDLIVSKFSRVEFAIIVVFIWEGISYIISSYRENSFYSFADISFLVLFFYWIKINHISDAQRIKIYAFLTALGVLFSIDGVLHFSRAGLK